jgi:hypothetical protein
MNLVSTTSTMARRYHLLITHSLPLLAILPALPTMNSLQCRDMIIHCGSITNVDICRHTADELEFHIRR